MARLLKKGLEAYSKSDAGKCYTYSWRMPHRSAAGDESDMGPGVLRHAVTEVIIGDAEDGETDLMGGAVLLELKFVIAVARSGSATEMPGTRRYS